MRIKLPPHPRNNQQRRRKTFLWWPVTIGRERRWLETATIFEYYTDEYPWGYWKKVRFVPDEFIETPGCEEREL